MRKIHSKAVSSLLCVAWATTAAAAITNVRVAGTTPTQAVIVYTAPDASACRVEVSESGTYSPPVHDFDPALFANADGDDRAGNISRGRGRIVVAGKRAAEAASDGKFYSRALQAFTKHYFRITCRADIATGTFETANIALGSTYTDPLPYDASNSTYLSNGQYAYPAMTGARGETVIDPQTGAAIKRLTRAPGARQYSWIGMTLGEVRDPDGAWGMTEPQLLSALTADDTSYATYSSSARDPLVVLPNPSGNQFTDDSAYSVDSITVGVIGWGAAANAEDRKLEICMTLDGVDCYGMWQEITLPGSDPGSAAQTTATTQPYLWDWTPPGKWPPGRAEYAQRSTGTVSLSGTTVTASSTGAFSPLWKTDSRITINNVPYTIQSVIDDKTLTVTSGSGDGSSFAWKAYNFGFIIRKKTATADAITLDRVSLSNRVTGPGRWASAGNEDVCAWVPSARSGRPGYHCVLLGTGEFYWVDAENGDSYLLGATTSGPGMTAITPSGSGLDPSHAGRIYYVGQESSGGMPVIGRWTYTGTNAEDISSFGDGSSGGISATMENLTRSPRNLNTLITEFDPTFDGTRWFCGVVGVQSADAVILRCLRSGHQDTLGWIVVFDPTKSGTAAGCVGGGSPGCVVAALSAMKDGATAAAGNPFKWCMLHYAFGQGENGWTLGSTNGPGYSSSDEGGGPFRATVSGSSVGIGDTSITITSEPIDPSKASGEAGVAGEYARVRPGDLACLSNSSTQNCSGAVGTHEIVRIIGKTENPDTTQAQTLTVQRGIGATPAKAWSGTVYLNMACGTKDVNSSYSPAGKLWWDYRNDPHGTNASNTIQRDATIGSHSVYKQGYYVDSQDQTDRIGARLGRVPETISAAFPYATPKSPAFAGVSGAGSTLESHPNWSQTDATAADKQWFVDLRPVLSWPLYGGAVAVESRTGSLFTLSSIAALDPKRIPVLAACGIQPLKDVSGPTTGNVLATDNSTPYQFCIAAKGNECRTGSTAGKIYVNCPYLTDSSKIWVYGNSQATQAMIQVGIKRPNVSSSFSRIISSGLSRHLRTNPFWSARPLPNGTWALFQAPLVNGQRTEILMAKLPPFPAEDSVNRATFVPVQVQLGTVPAGTDNAIAEFGYDPDLYCTSRREICAANSDQINATAPFYWASESFSGRPCSAGCMIAIPAISQRVVYYRLKYLSATGGVIATGPMQAIVSP